MIRALQRLLPLALIAAGLRAAPGDAARGGQLLETLGCNACHKFTPRWSGGMTPALERLLKTPLTPSRFTERVWNHAPKMWTAAPGGNGPFPVVSDQQASDLLTWFFAAGYFDPAGDARRGERVFTSGGCHVCHLMESGQGGGPAVSAWRITDATALLQGLWSHWPAMNAAMGRRRLVWPAIDAGEMRDLLAFVQSRFPSPPDPMTRTGQAEAGRTLFESKGCSKCHSANAGLGVYPQYRSFTELASSFWNHVPMMTRAPQPITRAEMADIVAFLWSVRYFEEVGSARRGGHVFQQSRCGECHPVKPRPDFNTASMVAAIWKHSPQVMQRMREKGILWPKLKGTEMEDLVAVYANTER